jgi:hypothetical protein
VLINPLGDGGARAAGACALATCSDERIDDRFEFVRRRLTIGASLILFALAAAPSTAAAVEWVTVPPEVKPARWGGAAGGSHSRVPAGSFSVGIDGGYCAGEEPPHIDHVRIVERPKTPERPFKSAVITVFKYIPEHRVPLQTEGTDETVYGGCAGIGRSLSAVVKLKRPLDHLIIYDGSQSPPQRKWPRVGH